MRAQVLSPAENSGKLPSIPVLALTPKAREMGLVAIGFTFGPLRVSRSNSGLDQFKETLFERCRSRYSDEFLAEDPVLAGFPILRQKTCVPAEEIPCSSQQLLKTFLKKGSIPSINTVVDTYNCIALETRLSIGAHDCANLVTPVRLDRTRGGEQFLGLRQTGHQTLSPGEYAYFSAEGEVICRLDAVQCEATKITSDTHTALFILQGHGRAGPDYLEEAAERLRKALAKYCQTNED